MKKIIVAISILALVGAPLQAQSFLEKMKQKAESVGDVLGEKMQGIMSEGSDESQGPGTDGFQVVTGEQALPAKRASTFGWDGPVTPSSAKFPIPLMGEFPALPIAQDLVNPVEEKQIAYYKAIKAVTLRAEELNTDTTCEDSETLLWRKKTNDGLKSAFGLTDEEVAILTDPNASEADQKRVSEKIEKSITAGIDVDALEADAAKYQNMSEAEMMAAMGNKTLEAQFGVYDKNAADIKKYMGVTTAELKDAAREQMASANPDKPSPKMKAIQKKSEAYQKAEAAKDPSFQKKADAFQQKMQGELRDATMKASRSMSGSMGNMADMMDQMKKKTAPFTELQTKLSKYLMDVQELINVGVESSADVSFAASERKKVLAIKSKIYQTRDASVYNPLYLEALEMIKSYRERAAKVWLADLQKRIDARKEALPKMVKLNRQAIADELIPECALYREPLNMVITTGDIYADAYSEFPSDYPKMYMEEAYIHIAPGGAGPGGSGFGGSGFGDEAKYHIRYDRGMSYWFPEFTVYGSSLYDAVLNGEMIYATDKDGNVYKHSGGLGRGADGEWVRLSDEEVKRLTKGKSEATPASQSWTSSDGKRTVYYNAEGGFIQLPEGDQAMPLCWKKVGNELKWIHMASKETGDGCFEFLLVQCTYKL